MTQDDINAQAAKQMADWIATQPGTFVISATNRQKIAEAWIKEQQALGYVLQYEPVVLSGETNG